jgi:hypothetical protein
VVETADEVFGVVERLKEVFVERGFAVYRDLLRQEAIATAVLYDFTVAVDGEIGTVNLLGGNPKDSRIA